MEQIVIKPEMIILQGITTQNGLCNTKYIVFRENGNIVITGTQRGWDIKNTEILVFPSYTRKLAKSLEEFYNISISKIEEMAYGAWMDGAR